MSPISGTLQEIIDRLPELPGEDARGEKIDHLLFAAKVGDAWTAHSPATAIAVSVYAEEDPPTPPGMVYFLEASVAREVIEVYRKWHRGIPQLTSDEATRAVIHYAVHDAYLPVERGTQA